MALRKHDHGNALPERSTCLHAITLVDPAVAGVENPRGDSSPPAR